MPMQGCFAGEMPVPEFLDEFLPFDDDKDPSPKSTKHFDGIKISEDNERTLYGPFMQRVNEALAGAGGKHILPGHKVVDTSVKGDPYSTSGDKNICDLHVYSENFDETNLGADATQAIQLNIEVETLQYDPFFVFDASLLTEAHTSSSRAPSPSGARPPQEYAVSESFLAEDPLDLIPYPLELDDEDKVLIRKQLAYHASHIMNRQHRLHLFTILILDTKARFIRWDRSGAIVSELLDYTQNSQLLIDFFWRFGKASDEQKGFDPTVSSPTPGEEEIARERLKKWAPKDFDRPIVVFSVPAADIPGKYHRYVAWGALANADLPVGRATRGWPACNIETKEIGFLKDVWRSDSYRKETDTLKKLNDAECRNVPTLVCGGDLRGQVTQTQIYAARQWNSNGLAKKIIKRTHFRFVVKEIGEPLSEFECSNDLLRLVFDAFIGHQDAYEKCGLLHRDISEGNILILNKDGRRYGMLNDWDLAEYVDSLTPDRIGTWEFMSYRLLQDQQDVLHRLSDDLESFLYVILFEGLIHVRHDNGNSVNDLISHIFEYEIRLYDGNAIGGSPKSWIKSTIRMFWNVMHAKFQLDAAEFTEDDDRCPPEKLSSYRSELAAVDSHDALHAIWDKLSPEFQHSSAADKVPGGYLLKRKPLCGSHCQCARAAPASRNTGSSNGQQRVSRGLAASETTASAQDTSCRSPPSVQADNEPALVEEPAACGLDLPAVTVPTVPDGETPKRPRSPSEDDDTHYDSRPSKRQKRDDDLLVGESSPKGGFLIASVS
ncbi:hypothetical protein HGRIS_011643 [Hohenbuehelia grisea]|uniref:Fungal-type protein kinase domain-containing protein n=1 Tax=Hohenbuehelia grisea TaxID=104357 RepID=A0ABR3JX38_9AGAR